MRKRGISSAIEIVRFCRCMPALYLFGEQVWCNHCKKPTIHRYKWFPEQRISEIKIYCNECGKQD